MPGTSIVQSGNYVLEIDTGFAPDAFTLDDVTKGVLDNTTYVLDGTTTYADVTDGTLNISVRRGRKDVGDQFSTGTMTFTLNDTLVDGIFNPFDTESPYYDSYTNVPGLAPMRRVRLGRYDAANTLEYLFKGYVVNYDYAFNLGGLNTVSVLCADDFYLLSQTYMDELNVNPETSGERIETVLDLPEVDYPTGPTARNISTGTVDLGHDSAYTVPAGTNVLAYLAQINQTAEFGRLFISRDGVLTFQDRIGTTLTSSVADFADTGTEIPFDKVGITFEADQVVNRTVVTGLNGTSSIDTNPASIATYFIQTQTIGNSLLHDAGQIATAADYLLEPEPEARYTDVSTPFLSLTTAQRDTLAIVDIGDTISISKTFPSGSGTTSLAQFLSIEGVEHMINVSTGHRVTYYTSPTTVLYNLILNDPVYGTLDSTNALASTAPPPPPVTVDYDMIYFQASSANPTDATTRYITNFPLSQLSTYSSAAITMSFTGTITSASINWLAGGTVGTSESISAYIRLNDTTDYLIASVANTNTLRVFTNTAMSIPIAVNDTIALKFVYPTWVTNPTTVSVGGYAIASIA